MLVEVYWKKVFGAHAALSTAEVLSSIHEHYPEVSKASANRMISTFLYRIDHGLYGCPERGLITEIHTRTKRKETTAKGLFMTPEMYHAQHLLLYIVRLLLK
jgi:hypothetical protein